MSKIILVGEALGQKEERFQHGFVGASGVELGRMLGQAGLAPNLDIDHPSELDMIRYWKNLRLNYDIEITNVFNKHPPDNNIDLFFTNAKEGLPNLPPLRAGKYLKPDHIGHLEALWSLLSASGAHLIVAFGNTASWATLGEGKISTIRGTVKTSPKLGIKVLPTYHPAAVLRQWNLRPIVLTDLEKAKRESEFKEIRRIERWVTVEPTLQEIADWIDRPAHYYAVDIETDFRRQISMIGFARSANDALVIPFIDQTKPNWNYWQDPEEELYAWKLADKALSRPIPKLFQNGVFDLSHLLSVGFRPTMCLDDTMLLHHALYPEMLKGLGFLGSVYSDEIAWKTMRTKGNNLKRDE
jgi:uracil-DNA glycosylase